MNDYQGPIRTAVVLAAGLGSRLGTPGGLPPVPKPLSRIADVPILHRTLRAMAVAGVRRAIIIVGHRAEEIIDAVGDTFLGIAIEYVHSLRYRETNNAYSLWLAREHLDDDDVFIVEGDVAFDAEVLTRLDTVDAPAVVGVAPWRPGMDGTVAVLDDLGRVSELILKERQAPDRLLHGTYKTINVHLLRRSYLHGEFVPMLDELIATGGHYTFYEAVLARSIERGAYPVHAADCGGLRWCEADTAADLTEGEYVFGTSDSRLAMLDGMHGGYWRYNVVDHRLLHNPYFPSPEMITAMMREFPNALVHYPPGQTTLTALLSAVVGQPAERLAIANGASELIKVMSRLLGDVVLTVPNFNEYEAVLARAGTLRRVELSPPTFALDPDAVIRCVRPDTDAVIVTSPNNPTSVLVPRNDLIQLAKALAINGTRLLVDESFIDFSSPGTSLADDLADHPNLVVIKSMSKAYGIGGLRLGYLATADLDFAATIREQLPIWNINGIAETFLRLLPRYASDFTASLHQVRMATEALWAGLQSIDGLYAYPPEANFVLVRLPEPWRAPVVTRALFQAYGLLVKDCAGKSMTGGDRYLRIASRTLAENQRLVSAFAHVLGQEPRYEDR